MSGRPDLYGLAHKPRTPYYLKHAERPMERGDEPGEGYAEYDPNTQMWSCPVCGFRKSETPEEVAARLPIV